MLTGMAGKACARSEPAGPLFLTTLPANMLNLAVHALPQSPPVASGGLWGRSTDILLFLRGKKAPAGALKTRIGILKRILKNVDFWKLLGMGWPGVGNVPGACGSILHLSRGSQEPYKKKSKFPIFVYITPDIPPRRPDITNICS